VLGDFARGVDQAQLAAHAQVNDQQATGAERDEDELSTPPHRFDAKAGDRIDEDLRLGVPDDGGKAQLAAHDRAADQVRPQVGNDRLYFR